MTEGDTVASFAGQGMENTFVTLDTAAVLTNFSPAYVERLCRDGYVSCAGGKGGEIFPNIAELFKVLNSNLSPGATVDYVSAGDIAVPALSREQLLAKSTFASGSFVGNLPVGINMGAVQEHAPLKRGALSFALVSDEEEVVSRVAEPPVPPKEVILESPPLPPPPPLPLHWPLKTSNDISSHFDESPLMPPLAPKASQPAPPSLSPIITQSPVLPIEQPQQLPEVAPLYDLITPPAHAVMALPDEAITVSASQDIMEQEEESLGLPSEDAIMAQQQQALLAPEQNLMQTVSEEIARAPVAAGTDEGERPLVMEPSVEQISTVADADWYKPQAEEGMGELPPPEELMETLPDGSAQLQDEVARTIVIDQTPPSAEEGIANRILKEALHSQLTIPEIEPETAIEELPPAEPIVAVPHYAVAQLTPSMHPLALPPRVVPFATMVPAAYPQVAAVFTQPHARASEWLPWMRTSHFSRSEVQAATNPEVHPSYPRYSRPAAQDLARDQREKAPAKIAPVLTSTVPASTQKVFVSVVGKPVAPISVPVVAHSVPIEAPPRLPIAAAEDAWDEMLAPQATRTQMVEAAYQEVPQKSRDELLKEVSVDIKDSWDASFLAGLGAA